MLNKLCTAKGASGREDEVRQIILEEIAPFCTCVKTDALGNVIAEKFKKNDAPNVLVVASMDERGLLISKIEDDGFLRFDTIGDIAVSSLGAKPVCIGECQGVIGQKAVHLTSKEEREQGITLSSLFMDIGASSCQEAQKIVSVGDTAMVDVTVSSFGEGFIKGRALGERMACFVAMEALKQNLNVNLTVLFAVQHQIGDRGLKAFMYGRDYDYGIFIGGIQASLTEEEIQCRKGVTYQGIEEKKAEKIAKKKGVLIQKTEEESPLSTFVWQIKEQSALYLPVRYKESVVQVANQEDLENAQKMLIALLEEIGRGEE